MGGRAGLQLASLLRRFPVCWQAQRDAKLII
jgi:hypothetical protein